MITGSSISPRWHRPVLEVRDLVSEGRHTLVLDGELDIASAPELESIVVHLCKCGTEWLVLDLNRVTFVDSSGLKAIISASELCAEHGCHFLATPGPPAVQRLFQITGLVEQPWLQCDGVDPART